MLFFRGLIGFSGLVRRVFLIIRASYHVSRGRVYVSDLYYDHYVVGRESQVYTFHSTGRIGSQAIHPLFRLVSYYYARDVHANGRGLFSLLFRFAYGFSSNYNLSRAVSSSRGSGKYLFFGTMYHLASLRLLFSTISRGLFTFYELFRVIYLCFFARVVRGQLNDLGTRVARGRSFFRFLMGLVVGFEGAIGCQVGSKCGVVSYLNRSFSGPTRGAFLFSRVDFLSCHFFLFAWSVDSGRIRSSLPARISVRLFPT